MQYIFNIPLAIHFLDDKFTHYDVYKTAEETAVLLLILSPVVLVWRHFNDLMLQQHFTKPCKCEWAKTTPMGIKVYGNHFSLTDPMILL